MTPWPVTAAAAARSLARNGLACGAVALLMLLLAPITAGRFGFTAPLGWLLLAAFSLAAVAFSVHLLFDALLFRLAASHETEATGVSAVDDLLGRMRLRQADAETRPLADRITGSRRIVWRQRLALVAGLVLYAILLVDAIDGACRC